MIEDKYEIWCGNTMLAGNMRINVAMIVVRALFENWYNETGLELRIKRNGQIDEDEEKVNQDEVMDPDEVIAWMEQIQNE